MKKHSFFPASRATKHKTERRRLKPQHNSDLYYSTLFLSPEQRAAIASIYAFQHEINSVANDCSNTEIASQKLDWWSSEIDRMFNGVPQHPIALNLAQVAQQYALQRLWFDEIVHAAQMDLRFQGYATMDDLLVYCHCAGSSLAMLHASVFGYTQHATLDYAKQLGVALQLVNLIRNVGYAARCNRIYIPEAMLTEFEINSQAILACEQSDKFAALMSSFAQFASGQMTAAMQVLPAVDRAAQRSGLIMAQINLRILQEIERSNFAILQHKISITPLRKLWIAWRTLKSEQKKCVL